MSFRHMQVMFTSSTGKVMEPNNFCVSVSGGGTPVGREDRNIIRRKVGPGEKITYLYRFSPPPFVQLYIH